MIFEALTLIVLLAGFGLLYFLIKSRLHKQDMMLNHLTEQHYLLSKQHSEFRDILEKHWQDETKRNAKLVAQVGEIKHEVVWLADEVRGDMLMNNAIEMARSGANAETVAEKTGIDLEEAKTLVASHGPKKS